MEKILAENVKRICKTQGKQMKDLAGEMEGFIKIGGKIHQFNSRKELEMILNKSKRI